jgi:hypothetical protein
MSVYPLGKSIRAPALAAPVMSTHKRLEENESPSGATLVQNSQGSIALWERIDTKLSARRYIARSHKLAISRTHLWSESTVRIDTTTPKKAVMHHALDKQKRRGSQAD